MENVTETIPMERIISFSWYDHALFGSMLGLSTIIGIYFGFFDKKESSADQYLLGGKEMKIFPIAMSLVASYISGITLLAVPADVYLFGFQYILVCFSLIIVCFISYKVYLPVFYKIQITSVYEYMVRRFDNNIRLITSGIYVVQVFLYLPIVIYIPALAFSQATGFSVHLITPVLCTICIFYTTIGGLKAVVWTDTLQLIAMIGGTTAVMIVGVIKADGITNIYNVSKTSGRLDIDFDITPLKRDTFWSILIGLTFGWMGNCMSQGFVQKFLALPSLKHGRSAIILFSIGMTLINFSSIFIGLIMYVTYKNCDPFSTKAVNQQDQLLPYYILDVASNIPGLPGLFIAGIVCAALSTLSATINSLSGTVYQDFVSPFMPKGISQRKVSYILKILVFLIGIISTALVFVVEHLGGLLSLSLSFGGATMGPMLGVFTLGMLIPTANSKGALAGTIGSILIMTWIAFGSLWYKLSGSIIYETKPLSTQGCTNYNITSYSEIISEKDEPLFIYKITYYYYTIMGFVLVFLIGIPVSLLTKNKNHHVNPDLISPVCHWLLPKENKNIEYYSVEQAIKNMMHSDAEKNESDQEK